MRARTAAQKRCTNCATQTAVEAEAAVVALTQRLADKAHSSMLPQLWCSAQSMQGTAGVMVWHRRRASAGCTAPTTVAHTAVGEHADIFYSIQPNKQQKIECAHTWSYSSTISGDTGRSAAPPASTTRRAVAHQTKLLLAQCCSLRMFRNCTS